MELKEIVERAFRQDGEKRILYFLREQELVECSGDSARWKSLFDKCEGWRNKFLLWERKTYIFGVDGWYLYINICKMRLPDQEPEDWTDYLYRMTLLVVISDLEDTQRDILMKKGDEHNNLDMLKSDFYVDSGYTALTQEQLLSELIQRRQKSWKRYQGFTGNSNPEFHKTMEMNYSHYDEILDFIRKHVKACQVVRMNEYGGDESVWYFVKA